MCVRCSYQIRSQGVGGYAQGRNRLLAEAYHAVEPDNPVAGFRPQRHFALLYAPRPGSTDIIELTHQASLGCTDIGEGCFLGCDHG